MDEAYQDQVTPSTAAPELTDKGVMQCQEKISPKRPGGRRKASAGKCKERPIAKRPYKGVIISVKVSAYCRGRISSNCAGKTQSGEYDYSYPGFISRFSDK